MPAYVYPPHPHSSMKIQRSQLDMYEKMGVFVAQIKYQGSRSPIKILNGEVEQFSRHGDSFKRYSLPKELKELFLGLKIPKDREVWLDGELLHEKAKSKIDNKQAQQNTVVLFDIIYNGGFMLDVEQMKRLDILAEMCGQPTKKEARNYAIVVVEGKSSAIWMAETFDRDFTKKYDEFDKYDAKKNDLNPLVEGLLLRRKKFKLPMGLRAYDTRDMVRCRRPNKIRNA